MAKGTHDAATRAMRPTAGADKKGETTAAPATGGHPWANTDEG